MQHTSNQSEMEDHRKSMEASSQHKEEGNKSFSTKDFASAITSYRCGLSALPPPDSDDDERNKCEVALRSNLALCLLRLAENPKRGSNKQTPARIREYLVEAGGECSAALMLEDENAKLWYRRGQSKLLLAHSHGVAKENSSTAADTSCDQLLSGAESDIRRCQELLQEQLDRQKHEDTPKNVNKAVISQIMEARKALKRIESDRVKLNLSVDGSNSGKSGSSAQSKSEANGKNEKKQREKSLSNPRNGLIAQFSRSISGRHGGSQTNVSSSSSSTANGSSSHPPPPSPSDQKEQILQLLLRRQPPDESEPISSNSQTIYPPQKGEAYFLIDMKWWSDWCAYVHFFQPYKNIHEEDTKTLKRKVCEVDVANAKILQYLPPGASLPPCWEREKKEVLGQNDKRKRSSDDSMSSQESSDSETDEPMAPMAIDNSSMILNQTGSWSLPNIHLEHQSNRNSQSNTAEANEVNIPLKSNLVRGYHFEILPREAYAALRSWYGEVSAPIMRRAQSVDELPWLVKNPSSRNNMPVRLALYGDRWDVIQQNHDVPTDFFLCCACRAPYAKSKCTKCKCARYCNKDCQKSSWPYHKNHCWSLMRQKFQNEAIAATNALQPDMKVWGRVGLNNLGNTCFMSSAVHCMSHVTPLTRLFLSNQYLSCLNENNINGTGGKVANAYAALIKDLWMGGHQHSSLSPTVLKRAIELFAPQFYGVQQQDSAEFLSYLLDALHEDLNMIRDPPYVEMPDVDRGRKLTVCGAETWDALCRRNSSYVFENFYGLYKSTCVCPKCETVSVTFDTFNHITLEIPRVSKLEFGIILFRDLANDEPALPVKYCVSVAQTGTVRDLIASLGSMCGIPASRLSICNVVIEKCAISQLYRDETSVSSLINEDLMVAYETAPFDDVTKVNVVVVHKSESGPFGFPLLLSFDRTVKCSDVYDKLWAFVKPFFLFGREEFDPGANFDSFLEKAKSCLRVRVTDAASKKDRLLRTGHNGNSTAILPPCSDDEVSDLMGLKDKEKFIFFSLEYPDLISHLDPTNFLRFMNHSSVIEYKSRVNRMHESGSVTLDQCFESFTQPERLDDDNMWYCSKCEEHVKAMKTVAPWKLPNILVIHLKRFEYRNSFDRNKIGTLVEFPVDGFDMKRHTAYDSSAGSGSNYRTELVDEDTPHIYDLFGVTNHYGRMGYGHYTAYARRFDEFGIETSWCEFDDENVSEVDANCIVGPSAYVLFYRKRVLL